jgi:flagellar biosynthetic protein FliQ
MSEALIIAIAKQAIWTAILVSAPILIVSLLIGLFISIFQAATSISDATLNFAPKVLGAIVVFFFTMPWMLNKLISLVHYLLKNIPYFIRG